MAATISYSGNAAGVSFLNSVSKVLTIGETWQGQWEDVSRYPSIVLAAFASGTGVMKLEFSADGGTTVQSTLTRVYDPALLEPPLRATVTRPYARVTFQNTSGGSNTLSLSTLVGSQTQLTSSIDALIAPDADASIIRPMNFELLIAEGKFQNRQTIFKDGSTPAMASGNVTQDLWSQAGAYTGFPLAAGELSITLASADVGTVVFVYLASSSSTDYTFTSYPVNGAGTYNTGIQVYRLNFAYFIRSNDPTRLLFNAGNITLFQRNTPANIFCVIPANQGQSNCAAFTVPAQNTGYLYAFNGSVRDGAAASSKGWVWYRELSSSPRLRNQFTLVTGGQYEFNPNYLFRLPASVDIMPRITNNSTNNMSADINYIVQLVKAH